MGKVCSVEGCDNVVHCRGYCPKHYERFMKYGDTSMVYQRPPRVKKVCPICNTEFEVVYSTRNRRQCCSKSCANKMPGRHPVGGIPVVCTHCGKGFRRKKSQVDRAKGGSFCSVNCYDEHQIIRVKVICDNCGIEFERIPCHAYKKKEHQFCSMGCLGEYFTGENSPNWRGGLSFEPYGREFNMKVKEYVRRRDNYTCQECGVAEDAMGRRLSVHHCDYEKNNNNADYNLITLCVSCNSIANANRGFWYEYYLYKLHEMRITREAA